MTSPFGPILLIVNPAAGLGRSAVLRRTVRALGQRGLDHTVALTRGPGDATRLARRAVGDGGRCYLVVVGGDGTVQEVVNGLIDAETGEAHGAAVLGIIAGGSGCDIVRTFGIGRTPEEVVPRLAGDRVVPIDVGRVRLRAPDGGEHVRLFVNIAEAGYGGLVAERANRLPRFLGASRYLVAVFAALRQLSMVATTVTTDSGELRSMTCNVVVANGRFFGGDMRVAPHALPDDGQFDVQVWRGKAGDAFAKTARIRRGTHLDDPAFLQVRSAAVRVEAERPLAVEADGEVLGTTPAVFDLLPRALNLKL